MYRVFEEANRRTGSGERKSKRGRRFKMIYFLLLIAAGCVVWNFLSGLSPFRSVGGGGIFDGEVQGELQMAGASGGFTEQGEQLKALIPQYPELSAVADHPEEYPQGAVELFLANPESIDYLVNYPKEANQRHHISIKEEMKQGTIPLFIQWDSRWGYDPYGSGLIGWTGCGPTCLSMAVTGLTGKQKWNPAAVAEFSEKNGYYSAGSGTSWNLMTEGAKKLGLSSREVSLSEATLKAELDEGHVIICSMRPGDFTTTGHYILIRGYDSNGFYVNDPNSRARSAQQWTYERISPQIKNLWAMSA